MKAGDFKIMLWAAEARADAYSEDDRKAIVKVINGANRRMANRRADEYRGYIPDSVRMERLQQEQSERAHGG